MKKSLLIATVALIASLGTASADWWGAPKSTNGNDSAKANSSAYAGGGTAKVIDSGNSYNSNTNVNAAVNYNRSNSTSSSTTGGASGGKSHKKH